MHGFIYLALPISLPFVAGVTALNSRAYAIQSTSCRAVDRVLNEDVNTTIDYVDVNPTTEKSIIMVHGWPI
ncbi:hypothetical protein BD769DRAFT_682282 [Suillus cothurnatus]|nr:hypothetical protein BD769DRAFT_682282 [Suillus cothurnatus]